MMQQQVWAWHRITRSQRKCTPLEASRFSKNHKSRKSNVEGAKRHFVGARSFQGRWVPPCLVLMAWAYLVAALWLSRSCHILCKCRGTQGKNTTTWSCKMTPEFSTSNSLKSDLLLWNKTNSQWLNKLVDMTWWNWFWPTYWNCGLGWGDLTHLKTNQRSSWLGLQSEESTLLAPCAGGDGRGRRLDGQERS